MPIVNKAELASIIGVSLPTMESMIRKDADFPIVQRGSNGVAWQFDTDAVRQHMTAVRERELAAAEAREAELAQVVLPGLDLELPASGKAADMLNAMRAQKLKIELEKQAGGLVWTHEVRQPLAIAVGELTRFLADLPTQATRGMGLPDEIVSEMENRIADAMLEFNTKLMGLLQPPANAA